MLRWTCPRDVERGPADLNGKFTLSDIHQKKTIAHSWGYLEVIKPYYCGQLLTTNLPSDINPSDYKMVLKVNQIKNAELVVQIMPKDKFTHLPGTSINEYVHMHQG